jgi:hypothetical protein
MNDQPCSCQTKLKALEHRLAELDEWSSRFAEAVAAGVREMEERLTEVEYDVLFIQAGLEDDRSTSAK